MDTAFIHHQFSLQVQQCKDDKTLIRYLLDATPTYGRICMGDETVTDEDIQEDLGFSMPDDPGRRPKARTELTPFGCPCSKDAYVCVDPTLAALQCMACGRIARAGFVHSWFDSSRLNTTPKFVYQPKAYFTQHLQRLQGQGSPRFDPTLLTSIRHNLTSRGIVLDNVTPHDMYTALQQLKAQRLYPHRWALTKRINPTFELLRVDDELEERLQCVFISCFTRYASQRAKTGRKRKFLSYPLFIFHALQYLGYHRDVEIHFKPLKNRVLADRYAHEIQRLLRGESLS